MPWEEQREYKGVQDATPPSVGMLQTSYGHNCSHLEELEDLILPRLGSQHCLSQEHLSEPATVGSAELGPAANPGTLPGETPGCRGAGTSPEH